MLINNLLLTARNKRRGKEKLTSRHSNKIKFKMYVWGLILVFQTQVLCYVIFFFSDNVLSF